MWVAMVSRFGRVLARHNPSNCLLLASYMSMPVSIHVHVDAGTCKRSDVRDLTVVFPTGLSELFMLTVYYYC